MKETIVAFVVLTLLFKGEMHLKLSGLSKIGGGFVLSGGIAALAVSAYRSLRKGDDDDDDDDEEEDGSEIYAKLWEDYMSGRHVSTASAKDALKSRYGSELASLENLNAFYLEWPVAVRLMGGKKGQDFDARMGAVELFLCSPELCTQQGGEALTVALTVAMASYNSAKGASNGLSSGMASTLLPAMGVAIRESFAKACTIPDKERAEYMANVIDNIAVALMSRGSEEVAEGKGA